MIKIPKVQDLELEGKNVLVRGDFDVDDDQNPRADSIRELVRFLQEKNAAKIKVIGHTETEYDLAGKLKTEFPDVEFDSGLRRNEGEKANDFEFAKSLAEGFELYVNESFATSHRTHASIVGVPKAIKANGGQVCVGLRFEKEIENLSKILVNPSRPLIFLISGVKEAKKSYVEKFSGFADKVLVGGRLPEYFSEDERDKPVSMQNGKLIIAKLMPDKEDITLHSIERFAQEIKIAGTIVVSGPIGKFEEEGHRQGTKQVLNAVANNNDAFKVAGGGDTEEAIELLDLVDGFDWISVGGGAMLEFLANKTLPGIESLV